MVWSLMRPLAQLLIYYVAIGQFLGAARSIPDFAIFVFAGLTAWACTARSSPPARTRSSQLRAGQEGVRAPRDLPARGGRRSAISTSSCSSSILLVATIVLGQAPLHAELAYLPLSILLDPRVRTALAPRAVGAERVPPRRAAPRRDPAAGPVLGVPHRLLGRLRARRDRRDRAQGAVPRQPRDPRRARHAEGDVGLGHRGPDAVLARATSGSACSSRSSSAECCCSSRSGSSPASRATSRRNCERRNHGRTAGPDRTRLQAVRAPQGQVAQGPHPLLGRAREVALRVPRARRRVASRSASARPSASSGTTAPGRAPCSR